MSDSAAPYVRPTTFSDEVYDVRFLMERADARGEIVCGRGRSVQVALALQKQGVFDAWWERGLLIARKRPQPFKRSNDGVGG